MIEADILNTLYSLPESFDKLAISLVSDLEYNRGRYGCYSYTRTIRNILTGNNDGLFVKEFDNKKYFGIFKFLSLEQTEYLMDLLVKSNKLEVIFTEHGKLYCTPEYYARRW